MLCVWSRLVTDLVKFYETGGGSLASPYRDVVMMRALDKINSEIVRDGYKMASDKVFEMPHN